MKYPHVEKALRYARDVVAGRIDACKWARLACERALKDRERAKGGQYPYRFDPERAEDNCRFAESFSHVKGKWAGMPYVLEPWQCFRRCEVFGWVRKVPVLVARPDGTTRELYPRRFREAYLEVPRKNGKSMEESIDGDYCFAADGEHGAECYSGATTEKQAWEVFRPARLLALNDSDFREAFGVEVNAKSLYRPSDESRFEPLIGKPGDGASPHWACADEYHEHDTDDFVDTMLTGMMAREQPLMEYATTAGDNIAGPCYAKRDEVQKMLLGVIPNEELWGIIYTLDEGDDWTTEAALRKANPNYGVSVNPEILGKAQAEAIRNARKQGVFKTKHLNVWVGSRAAWFNMEDWKGCAKPGLSWEDCTAPGWECRAVGLDMAMKTDFSSAVFVFRNGNRYRLKALHFLPEDTANDPTKQHYLAWVKAGRIITTEGGEIDYDRVEEVLAERIMAVGAKELAYDVTYAVQVAQGLERRTGIQRVEMPMGTYKSFSAAMRDMEAAAKTGRLEHDGDEVYTWMQSNVVAKEDGRGNLYPRKERPELKIDAPVAGLLGWTRSMGGPEAESVYEQHSEDEWRQAPVPVVEGVPAPPPVSRSIYEQHTAEEWAR